MTSVLRESSLVLIARDDKARGGVAGGDALRINTEPPARRRDYYGLVWRTAGKKTRERVVPSTTAGLVTTVVGTVATLGLGATVGPALMSVPLASDSVERSVLALATFLLVAAVRGVWALGDELLAAPVQLWAEGEKEATRLTGERNAIQKRLTDDVTALEQQITTLLTPSLELYADDLSAPPFFQEDGASRGQFIVKVGLRTRPGVRTVRGVRVRLERAIPMDGAPKLELDAAAPLELQGGTTPFGIDLHPGEQRYAQLFVVRPAAARALPSVRVFYWPPALTEHYAPLPLGEWLLEIRATGEDTSPDIRYITLTVTNDPDPHRRVTLTLHPDDDY